MCGAAANPEVPSGRLGSCFHFLPLLLGQAQHPSVLRLHNRAGGARLGRSVCRPCPAGQRGAALGHGSTSTRGAEQNPGSTSSAGGPGWRFGLFHTESGEAVGLKQSSCCVSVITARNQQLPSPGAGPCHTAAPQHGPEHEAWQAASLSQPLLTLLRCLLINKLNILLAFEQKPVPS